MAHSSLTLSGGCSFSETDFSHELARLYSFRDFPDAYYNMFLIKLVNMGFYYSQHGDTVRCFSCGLGLHVSDLTELDNVSLIHKERSPHCVFLLDFIWKQKENFASVTSNAAFPKFLIGKTRFTSLTNSGINHSLAMDLARNGFFSDGKRNKVRCFHCGTEVHLHKNHMCMHTEHGRKEPNCTFLRQKPVSALIEWTFDGTVENSNSEICPPSSTDVMLEKAASTSRLMCSNCQQNEKCVTFLPCSHSCLCKVCQMQMNPRHCLVCQHKIDSVFCYQLASL